MAIAPQQEVREQFARNLFQARTRRGLSQHRLAVLCGLNRTEISLFERSERSPRLEMIVLLAKALEIEPQELLAGID